MILRFLLARFGILFVGFDWGFLFGVIWCGLFIMLGFCVLGLWWDNMVDPGICLLRLV